MTSSFDLPDDLRKVRELASLRKKLGQFCRSHYPSVIAFYTGALDSEVWEPGSDPLPFFGFRDYRGTTDTARHLTTAARSIESLLYCPSEFIPDLPKGQHVVDPVKLAAWFAADCLQIPPTDWTSGGSAPIYTRARVLPLVLAHVAEQSVDAGTHRAVIRHLFALCQPLRFQRAIGEEHYTGQPAPWQSKRFWPPNAYYSYWTLRTLANFETSFLIRCPPRLSDLIYLIRPPDDAAHQDKDPYPTAVDFATFFKVPQSGPISDMLYKLELSPDQIEHITGIITDEQQSTRPVSNDRLQSAVEHLHKAFAARFRRRIMDWVREELATQIALHDSKSGSLDSDQLGWALASFTRYDSDVWFRPVDRELIKRALKCLFDHQLEWGIWRHHQPVFHNVYGAGYPSYFELFAELIKNAMQPEAGYLHARLSEYRGKLEDLLDYAMRRAVPLANHEHLPAPLPGAQGWTSGHRVDSREPEGWATASVFSFAQQFRRLVGAETCEAALQTLSRRRGVVMDAVQSDARLTSYGTTCVLKRGTGVKGSQFGLSAEEQLRTLFVNPMLVAQVGDDRKDPSHRIIRSNQARSAVLFGPPGTGKTSLARGVAEAIGWKFVEIHVSDFVAYGHGQIERRADEIFEAVYELDRCVVLFDEVEELFRSRTGDATDESGLATQDSRTAADRTSAGEPDRVSRFLTTSMLPKLAELWDQRRILYFIATNRPNLFDAATVRPQRIDCMLFVGPPSIEHKAAELTRLLRLELGMEPNDASGVRVQCSQQNLADRTQSLLAMRHDQLITLIPALLDQYYRQFKAPPLDTVELTGEMLHNVLVRSDDKYTDKDRKRIEELREMAEFERIDSRVERAFEIMEPDRPLLHQLHQFAPAISRRLRSVPSVSSVRGHRRADGQQRIFLMTRETLEVPTTWSFVKRVDNEHQLQSLIIKHGAAAGTVKLESGTGN